MSVVTMHVVTPVNVEMVLSVSINNANLLPNVVVTLTAPSERVAWMSSVFLLESAYKMKIASKTNYVEIMYVSPQDVRAEILVHLILNVWIMYVYL